MGITLYNQTEGPMQHVGLMAAYAYHIALNNMRLSLGLSGMLTEYHLNTSLFNAADPSDPALYSNTSAFIPDINFGVLLYNRLFYVGASANGLVNLNKTMDHEQAQPDVVVFGGNKFLVNEKFTFEPSLFLWRYGDGTTSVEVNAKLYYHDDNWLLLAYHGSGEIIVGVGVGIKRGLKLSYTYTISTNGLASITGGSQNISLIANIDVLKQKYKYSW